MKRISLKRYLILILIFLVCFSSTVYAAPVNNLIVQQNNKQDKEFIKNILNNGKDINPIKDMFKNKKDIRDLKDLNITNENDMIYGEPYKVYYFEKKDEFKNFLDGMRFDNILKNEVYYWEVPILLKENGSVKPASSVDISHDSTSSINDGWFIDQYPGYIDPDKAYFSSNPDQITSFLKQNGIQDADVFIHAKIPMMYDFLYILSENKEYFIPLSNYYGTEPLKLYTRDEFQKIFTPLIQNSLNNGPLATGGAAVLKNKAGKVRDKTSSAYIYAIALILVILSSAAFYYYKKRKL